MSATTYITLVFTGHHQEMVVLDQYLNSIFNNSKNMDSQQTISDHGSYSSFQFFFETSWNPPFDVIDRVHHRFPSIKGVHRITSERNFYETVIIRADPTRGFQKCLVDDPLRINTDVGSPSIDVLNEYIEDLELDEELRTASEIVGITIERIQQRREDLLESI